MASVPLTWQATPHANAGLYLQVRDEDHNDRLLEYKVTPAEYLLLMHFCGNATHSIFECLHHVLGRKVHNVDSFATAIHTDSEYYQQVLGVLDLLVKGGLLPHGYVEPNCGDYDNPYAFAEELHYDFIGMYGSFFVSDDGATYHLNGPVIAKEMAPFVTWLYQSFLQRKCEDVTTWCIMGYDFLFDKGQELQHWLNTTTPEERQRQCQVMKELTISWEQLNRVSSVTEEVDIHV